MMEALVSPKQVRPSRRACFVTDAEEGESDPGKAWNAQEGKAPLQAQIRG